MTTNREWLNNLASTDIPGLDAWMNAEHTDGNPLTDNLMRSVAENLGSEPGNGSQVGSEVDSRTQLEADIQAWLCANVGISVWLTDVVEQVHGWLDRQAAITERECASTRVNFAERVEFVSRIDELKANRRWQAETIRRLSNENDELKSKLNYLEGHGVEIVDAVAGGYEVYNEWYRKAKELEEAMAMDSRIRAQQSDAVDNLAKQRDELLDEVNLEHAKRSILQTQVRKLTAERDEAVEAYDAHMAAHDAWHEAEDITYTRNRFAIYEQATKERIARLESERDALAADLKECMELNDKLSDERERWRGTCGMMADAAHEIQRILDGLEGRDQDGKAVMR